MDEDFRNEKEVFAELAKVKTAPRPLKIETDVSDDDIIEEQEGQLTIDVFQDDDNIYVQSTIAGVAPDDLDINITKEAVTIRGSRERQERISEKDFFYQECFWGRFSRSVVLPQEIDPDKSTAAFKNGILTIKMPKMDRKRTKNIKVKIDS